MIAKKKAGERKPQPVTVHVNFPPEVIEQIDLQAQSESRTRVNMIQVLVKQALDLTKEAIA